MLISLRLASTSTVEVSVPGQTRWFEPTCTVKEKGCGHNEYVVALGLGRGLTLNKYSIYSLGVCSLEIVFERIGAAGMTDYNIPTSFLLRLELTLIGVKVTDLVNSSACNLRTNRYAVVRN